MSLTVRQLNADSTFLLTFEPSESSEPRPFKFSSSFSILVDPWLDGHYTVWKPSFAIAHHTTKPIVSSLAEIATSIDVILISQDKSDHCHRESLCTLPRDTNITIVATPAAAKKIRSWKYFDDPKIIHALPAYHPNKSESILRIPIQPTSDHVNGHVTFANIPSKLDMASLHNAIGITYVPPTERLRTSLPKTDSGIVVHSDARLRTCMAINNDSWSSMYTDPINLDFKDIKLGINSPSSEATSLRTNSSADVIPLSDERDVRRIAYPTEDALSVLYSPHGVSKSTIQPYVSRYLATVKGALPLTALFHSFNVEANPWYMGGIVSAGAPGGVRLAQGLKAKHWISAHDEIKDVSGMAVKFIRKHQYDVDEVAAMLPDSFTEIIALKCGEEQRLSR